MNVINYEKARMLLEVGQFDMAMEAAASLYNGEANTISAASIFVEAALQSGRTETALAFTRDVCDDPELSPGAYFLLGAAQSMTNGAERALTAAVTMIETAPFDFSGPYYLAGALKVAGRDSEAILVSSIGDRLAVFAGRDGNGAAEEVADFTAGGWLMRIVALMQDAIKTKCGPCSERRLIGDVLNELGFGSVGKWYLELDARLAAGAENGADISWELPDNQRIVDFEKWDENISGPAEPISRPQSDTHVAGSDLFVDHVFDLVTGAPNDWRIYEIAARALPEFGHVWAARRLYLFGMAVRTILEGPENVDMEDYLTGVPFLDDPGAPMENGWVDFVCSNNIGVRQYRVATAVRGAGLKIRLFYPDGKSIEECYRDSFDEIVPLRRPFDLWRLVTRRPVALHIFADISTGFFEPLIAWVLAPRSLVIDYYETPLREIGVVDSQPVGSDRWKMYDFYERTSRFLYNHSGGICSRNLCSRPLWSQLARVRQFQKRILLPEYPNMRRDTAPKLSASDGKLRVVSGGNPAFELDETCDWNFIRDLCAQADALEYELHLYYHDTGFGRYLSEFGNSKSVYLHRPLSPFDWMKELGKYDVGVAYIFPDDLSAMGNAPRRVDLAGAWTNQFVDYIEADTFFLSSHKHKFLSFVAERYGVGISTHPDDVFTHEFWQEVRRRVFEDRPDFDAVRRKFSAAAQGPRLEKFYRSIGGNAYRPGEILAELG